MNISCLHSWLNFVIFWHLLNNLTNDEFSSNNCRTDIPMRMKTSTKEEKEREEIEIERKVWSTCFLCEEEYSTPNNIQQQQQQQEKEGGKEVEGNIVMNMDCLHSFCKECIEQSASTSLLCPICHSSLPTPLSSLSNQFHTLLLAISLSSSPFFYSSFDTPP